MDRQNVKGALEKKSKLRNWYWHVIKLRNISYLHNWIEKLFSEDNKVAGPATYEQTETVGNYVALLRSVCLFSLLSHENKESLFI